MPNFKTKNEGVWFPFDEDNPELGGVCVRILSQDAIRTIEKATTKVKKRFVGGQLHEEKKTDEKKEQEMIYNYCITGWKNIKIDGSDADCTPANKAKAMTSLDFAKFVTGCLRELTTQNATLDEAREKNFESTSSGSTQSQTVTGADKLTSMQDESQTANLAE